MHMTSNITPQRLPIVAPVLALLLSGCGDHDRHRDFGRERGRATTETREVGDFDSISLRGSAQLQVKVGEPASLTIEGDEQAVQRLKTEVDGDTLRIRTSRKEWMIPGGTSRLVIRITVPKLEELRLEGGNDVRLSGFDGGDTTIDIEGAANVKANGRLDELKVHMSGAGHADLRELIAAEADVTVDGVGSVYVHSTESLDATMNGVGAILYSGTPREVNTSMNGVGTISKDREHKRDNEPAEESEESKPEPDLELERDDKKRIDPTTLQPEYEI